MQEKENPTRPAVRSANLGRVRLFWVCAVLVTRGPPGIARTDINKTKQKKSSSLIGFNYSSRA